MNKSYIYTAYTYDDDIRLNSSSGGIFSVLAEKIISCGGSVWGAAYDENFDVVHKEISSIEEISVLRGSKYVQSRMGVDVLHAIKERLKKDDWVLFCGTPCQVVTVIRYVGTELRDKLLAVDFTCHGTPDKEIWRAYLKELKERGTIKSINMRSKRFGWKTYSIDVLYESGLRYSQIFTWNHYFQAFLRNYSLRKSCYRCQFKGVRPLSDITLADSWNVRKEHPEIKTEKGISKVYIHTDRGHKFYLSLRKSIYSHLDGEIMDFLTPTQKIFIPSQKDMFIEALKNEGFTFAYKKYVRYNMYKESKEYLKGIIKILIHYKNIITK